jgi:hypothetical protein
LPNRPDNAADDEQGASEGLNLRCVDQSAADKIAASGREQVPGKGTDYSRFFHGYTSRLRDS